MNQHFNTNPMEPVKTYKIILLVKFLATTIQYQEVANFTEHGQVTVLNLHYEDTGTIINSRSFVPLYYCIAGFSARS